MTPRPTRTPIMRTHPLTGLPITPLGMSKRGPVWPILGGDDTVTPPAPTPTPTPPPGGAAPATPPSSGDTPPGGEPAPPKPAEPKFTQADLDRILTERLAKEKATHEAALKQLQDTAGKSDLEAATIKLKAAEEARAKERADNALALAKTRAELAANLAGARDDRLSAVLAQADLSSAIDDSGVVDPAKVAAAVEKVLTDYPEWKKGPGDGLPNSSGTHIPPGSGGDSKPTYTRAQIVDMTKRMNNEDDKTAKATLAEINAAMAEGRIKG